jgi:hydroxyacylglutathione hydrolase
MVFWRIRDAVGGGSTWVAASIRASAVFEMREIAPGIWQPRTFPRNAINVFFSGGVLFDCGARWHAARLLRQLRDVPVELIALTHAHPDHTGAACRLRTTLGCPVACHGNDAPSVNGTTPPVPHHSLMRTSGWFFGGPPCPVDRLLREGEVIGGFRVVHAPGHTPGHLIFFRERDRAAIVGDVLFGLNPLTLRSGLREPPPIFTVDPDENRRSIAKLIALAPSILLFGHGPARQGASVNRELAAILERCEKSAPAPAIETA